MSSAPVGECYTTFAYPLEMENLADRLRAARKLAEKTQRELAKHLNIDRVNVTQWESGLHRPGRDRLPAIAAYYGVSLEWLMTGNGPMKAGSSQRSIKTSKYSESPGSVVMVPVISSAQAGTFMEVDDTLDGDTVEWVPTIEEKGAIKDKLFAVRVVGDSIDQVCPDGGYALCIKFGDLAGGLRPGIWVVADRLRGTLRERTIKRVVEAKSGVWELHPASSNPKHKPIKFPSGLKDESVQVSAVVYRFIGPTLV